jgi:class 3 adenylate cyclase
MPDREIRYCTTEDGVRIAYCIEGNGPTTIIAMPVAFETFSLDHMMPVYQQFYRDLGAGRSLVRFDQRGTGLSDRVTEFPENYRETDLAAVARSVGADKYAIWAPTTSGPSAIGFVAGNADLVSHLVLYGTYATWSEAFSHELLNALENLVNLNWDMATQTLADMNGRREFPEEAAQLGEWYRESMSGETYLAWTRSPRPDFRPLLSQIEVPTLVLHRINDNAVAFSNGQALAAGIPNARIVPLEGPSHLFCLGDYQPIIQAVDSFLGDREPQGQASTRSQPATVHTILFTDVEGSTALTQRLGDAKARQIFREHERITREALAAHGGAEVKTMGDGFMTSFTSATSAIECAIAMQRSFAEHNASADVPIKVRIGLNAGEPIAEDEDLFGTAVNMAARICAKAEGGQILAPVVVRELVAGKGFLLSDVGETELRGFEDPVRLYEVRWRENDR